MTHLDVCAALNEIVESLGNRTEEAGTFEYDVRSRSAGCVLADELYAVLRVGYFRDIDRQVCAKPFA